MECMAELGLQNYFYGPERRDWCQIDIYFFQNSAITDCVLCAWQAALS